MTDIPILERKRFNEEIERVFMDTAIHAKNLLRYNHTKRGSDINLYEDFFDSYCLLVIMTSDLTNLEQSSADVEKAVAFIKSEATLTSDKQIEEKCRKGVESFLQYKKLLSNKAVIGVVR